MKTNWVGVTYVTIILAMFSFMLWNRLHAPPQNNFYLNSETGDDDNDCASPTSACRSIGAVTSKIPKPVTVPTAIYGNIHESKDYGSEYVYVVDAGISGLQITESWVHKSCRLVETTLYDGGPKTSRLWCGDAGIPDIVRRENNLPCTTYAVWKKVSLNCEKWSR